MDAIVLVNRGREAEFLPLAEADVRTPGQRQRAAEAGCMHAARFEPREPTWLVRVAAQRGYRAVCLGYTRSRFAGYVLSETWGLAPATGALARAR